jgi:hypothetical protein
LGHNKTFKAKACHGEPFFDFLPEIFDGFYSRNLHFPGKKKLNKRRCNQILLNKNFKKVVCLTGNWFLKPDLIVVTHFFEFVSSPPNFRILPLLELSKICELGV